MVRRTVTALLLATALLIALVVGGAAPAAAHTEVLRAEPAPGEEVTGVVDEVELTFLDPVLPGATISVAHDDGEPVEGLGPTAVSDDGLVARLAFDPLTTPGGYVVEYSFTAADGDQREATYRFTFRGAGGTESGLVGSIFLVVSAAVAVTALIVGIRWRAARR